MANSSKYRKKQYDKDTHVLHNQKKEVKDERELAKDLSVEDIFFVLTRQGVEGFLPMVENTIERVVSKVVEEKLKEAAKGIQSGLESFKHWPNATTGRIEEILEEVAKEPKISFTEIEEVEEVKETEIEPVKEQIKDIAENKEPVNKGRINRRKRWSSEEDMLIAELVKKKPTVAAACREFVKFYPERSVGSTENRWYTKLMQKPE
jgi:hypothetical protein